MPDLGPLFEALSPILGAALKAFIKTTVGMIITGLTVASGCFYIAAEGSWVRGLLAFFLAMVLFAVIGGMLAVKRAVMGSIAEGLRKYKLGTKVAGSLFDRITGILNYSDVQGDRGNTLSKTAEKIPLARAEATLRSAIEETVKATPQGGGISGWLRRKIQSTILEKVEVLTLARFRQHGADVGGIDLALVKDELCATVDVMILETISGTLTRVTAMFVAGAVLGASVMALAIRRLPI